MNPIFQDSNPKDCPDIRGMMHYRAQFRFVKISRKLTVGVTKLFKQMVLLLAILVKLVQGAPAIHATHKESKNYFVDPFIGTDGHGHTYPGATLPFGMVQLSPDTRTIGWDSSSGYHSTDSSILGFSHTHLSGTGVQDLLDVLVTPITSNFIQKKPNALWEIEDFQDIKGQETAQPGYYSINLRTTGVRVELTATKRVGIHRYHFPESEESAFILDLGHPSPSNVVASFIKKEGAQAVSGYRITNQWGFDRRLFFYAEFSEPMDIDFFETVKGGSKRLLDSRRLGKTPSKSSCANEASNIKINHPEGRGVARLI